MVSFKPRVCVLTGTRAEYGLLKPLLKGLAQDPALQHPHLRTLHRPANLEDLFLKLTGRQIREDG